MAAINAPAGFRDGGVGFGVSVIGPAWSEARLLAVAEQSLIPALARRWTWPSARRR